MANTNPVLISGRDYATFHLGDLFFGIPATDVIELSRNLDVTAVPKGPSFVSGLINLRGQLLPAINMHIRLGISVENVQHAGVSIILETSGGPVALLVDSVGEILSLLPAELEPPPNKLTELAKEVVTGVYIRPEQLLLILDPLKIVSGATRESPVTPSK